jgi:hypothetical protein
MASGRRGFGGGSNHAGDPGEDPRAADGAGPVDVVAVRRDDELIDAIAADGPVPTSSSDEYQLAMLLANWRAELVSPPLPSAPDLDTVVEAVNLEIGARRQWAAGRTPGGRNRLRLVRPVGVAAACLAVIGGLTTAFSYSAHPGDPLWKVKQVVFSQQANSTQAQVDVGADLDQAQAQIDQGNAAGARQHLDKAALRANDVSDEAARQQLQNRWTRLSQQVRGLVAPSAPSGSQTTPRRSTATSTPTTPSGHRPQTETTTTQPGFQLPQLPPLPTFQLPTIPGLPSTPPQPPAPGQGR